MRELEPASQPSTNSVAVMLMPDDAGIAIELPPQAVAFIRMDH